MFRWAIVSNSTVAPLLPRLKKEVTARKHECEFFITEHGDMGRQVFQPLSGLYAFKPDLMVIYLDLEQIRPRLELSLALEGADARNGIVTEVVGHVAELLKTMRVHSRSTMLVNSFTVLPRTALGIGLDPVYRRAIRRMNEGIQETAASLAQCYVYDMESLWVEAGYQAYDRRFELMAQFPFGVTMQQVLVGEWLRYFRAMQGLTRKCVVLDLDNTLWGGVLGEDGPDGIRLGDTPEGRPFRRFQEALKALCRRGTLLAINSKNNPTDVLPVLREHPDMVLREHDFAAMQINWDDKAANMSRLSQELNIGLSHIVFLDDSASERCWLRERHPEVLVPEMPLEASGYADVLSHCELDTLTVTDEDRKRGAMYWQEKQRRILQNEAPSFEQFLQNLKLVVEIERLRPELLERAAQLCQRTNQFNLTTRRHAAGELKRFAESSSSAVFMMKVSDRFGDYGWSGLAIVVGQRQSLLIETFLMSCRVMGKNAEFAFMSGLFGWAAKQGCTRIRAEFIPTSKNMPCKEFLTQCGFSPEKGCEPGLIVQTELCKCTLPQISHINVILNFNI